ncbi:MAG: hypothetical protein ABIZ80_15735, partial [Bryobacteraceae bacterium]
MTTCLEKHEKLIFIAVLLLGLTVTHRQMLFSGFALTHGDSGDSVLVNFLLEHGYLWATGDPLHNSYWDPPFFAPHKNVGAYTEALLSVMPFYGVPRLLGAGPATAYQIFFFLVSLVNFTVCFLFLKKELRFSALASSIGAYLFSFAAARSNQFSHIQLWPQFLVVLSVWGLMLIWRLPHAPSRRDVVRAFTLCAAPVAAQVYSNVYYAWFLGLGYVIVAIYALVQPALRRQIAARCRRLWLPACLTTV